MQRNKQKVLSFMVTNYGNGETGAITVSLPDVEWMSLVGDATMESIQVGESCAFSVMLFPDNNVGLNQYSGSIAVNCANGSGTSIPYRFEAVADTATTVIVDVTDDFTYNTNGGFGPHLAGANVRLKGYYSLETVGEGLTDENGLFVMNDVPEGYYYLYVSADSHLGYSNIIYVDGGQTTRESHQEVYLQYQAITYSWVVVPTEVEDEYEFELVCEIKTNVPVPVVTIQAPTAFDPIEYGDTIHFNMTVRNDGLVDALGVEINMPNEFVEYKFSSLYDFIDTLHANTMVTVPCALTRVPSDDRSVDDCVEGSTRIRHHYYCNYERRWVEFGHPVQITTHCTQTNPNEINFHHLAYEYGFLDWPTGTSGTYYPGGGGGGNGNGGGEPTDPNYDEDDPVAPGSTTHPITIPTNDGCTPCWKVVASAATNLIDAFFGFHTNSFTTCASDAFDYAGEVTFGTVASRALRFGSCVITNIKLSDILDSFMLGRFWSLVNSIKDLIKGYNECYKTVDEPTDRDVPQMDVLFDELDQVGTILEATAGIFDNLFGDEAWHYEPNLDEFIDNFLALVDTTNYTMSPQAMQQLIEISDLSYVSTEHVEAFVERWNRSVEYWDAGYQTEADLPAGYDPDFFQDVSEFVEKFDEVQEAAEAYGYSDVDEMLNHSINGISAVVREHETDVCAKITIQFNQTMTMTREAFEGTLKIYNGHTFNPMQDIDVNIVIKDESGVDRTDLFQINVKSLSQLTGVDGTGTLDAQTEGTVVFEMIPTIEAAPETPQFYSFGGSFSFIDPFEGEELTYPLFPVRLQVNPSPNLHVDYFISRHIISDDPLTTDTVEATEPAEIAMMIRNVGAGNANNVYLQSAQPQIVENQNGLLIQFNMVSSAMNGVPRPIGLTDIPFGTIESNSTAIAEWYFTSSLLARVISTTPRVIHNNSWGNPQLSLVTELHSHELIKAVNAYGELEDGINDFLVNETVDFSHTPDIIYFSHGGTAPVSKMLAAFTEGTLTNTNRIVQLIATPNSEGWNYACVDDPAEGQYDIVSCTRNDGQEIPLSNVWITWATMPDDGSPVHENKLHIVDNFATGQMATYTIEYEPVQASSQQINLAQGWNWWSSYIDLSNDGLTALEEALGDNGIIVKSNSDGFVTYEDGAWFGSLTSINNEQMYKINMNNTRSAAVTGSLINVSSHPITINSGWNWISFPINHSMGVSEAFGNFSPATDDILKGRNGFTTYYSYNGTMGWFGSLNTLEPGSGYMYQSQSNGTKTLVFPSGRGDAIVANVTPEDNVYRPDDKSFADNMTVMAVVETEGEELRSDSHELAAFVDGECRGSVRLLYVEPIDRYVAFLTVFGEMGDALEFRLTDGTEAWVSADMLSFASDGVVGTLASPKLLHFGTLGVGETMPMVRIYPNPARTRETLNIALPEASGRLTVEIGNMLGVTVFKGEVVVEPTSVARITLPDVALPGTYVLKATAHDGTVYYGKLVVE
jgi:hypothetical protein